MALVRWCQGEARRLNRACCSAQRAWFSFCAEVLNGVRTNLERGMNQRRQRAPQTAPPPVAFGPFLRVQLAQAKYKFWRPACWRARPRHRRLHLPFETPEGKSWLLFEGIDTLLYDLEYNRIQGTPKKLVLVLSHILMKMRVSLRKWT